MKVLKADDIYIDASTPEKELEAFLAIFRVFDDLQYYTYLAPEQQSLFTRAKAADAAAAKKLLKMRRNYDCEFFEFIEVENAKSYL